MRRQVIGGEVDDGVEVDAANPRVEEVRRPHSPRLSVAPGTQLDEEQAAVAYQIANNTGEDQAERYSSLLAARGDVDTASFTERLADRILANYIKADAERGIDSFFVKTSDDEIPRFSLVRDARHLTEDTPEIKTKADRQHYKSMLFNYVLALSVIEKSHLGQVQDEDTLLEICHKFEETVANAHDAEQYFLATVKFVVAPILVEKGLADNDAAAIKMLDKAKDWAAMELDSMDIMTIDQVSKDESDVASDIVRLDTPTVYLTQAQVDEFSRTYEDQAWFQNMSAYEQRIYEDHYRDKILQLRVLPSQLRDRIPGLKNAFHSQTFVSNGEQKLKKVSDFFHCGSMPYVGGDQNTLISSTLKTAKQQSQISHFYHDKNHQSTSHVMLTLNSATTDRYLRWGVLLSNLKTRFFNWFRSRENQVVLQSYTGYDEQIVSQTRLVHASTEVDGMNSENLCLNAARHFESTRGNAIKQNILGGAGIALRELKRQSKTQRSILQELRKKPNLAAQVQRNQEILDRYDAMTKSLRVKVNKLKRKQRLFTFGRTKKDPTDANVKNVQILRLATQISHQLEAVRALDEHLSKNVPSVKVWFGCASGENRTGVAEFVAQTEAVKEELLAQGYDAHEISKTMATGHHIQTVVGSVGGSAGMVGIRSKSMGSLPATYNYDSSGNRDLTISTTLASKTADNKSVSSSLYGYENKNRKCIAKGKAPRYHLLDHAAVLALQDGQLPQPVATSLIEDDDSDDETVLATELDTDSDDAFSDDEFSDDESSDESASEDIGPRVDASVLGLMKSKLQSALNIKHLSNTELVVLAAVLGVGSVAFIKAFATYRAVILGTSLAGGVFTLFAKSDQSSLDADVALEEQEGEVPTARRLSVCE